ncbi:MAG: hypothetical protein C4K60_17755 [Ideonella sp. MAG2]|nr:MAG: hypothetical protein C4K60_17755 [Ideonella sp. MAG2]
MSTISGIGGSTNAWATANSQRAQKMFAKVDTDGSKGVDQNELNDLLKKVADKTGASFEDSKKIFSKMDGNADGSLSFDELDQGMKQLLQPPASTLAFAEARPAIGGQKEPDDMFAQLDTDGDGSISKSELKVLTDKIKTDSESMGLNDKPLEVDATQVMPQFGMDEESMPTPLEVSGLGRAYFGDEPAANDTERSGKSAIASLAQQLYAQAAASWTTHATSGMLSAAA